MRQYVLIALLLFFCACSVDKPITLYAINMMYACECPRYRVFRVEDTESRLTDGEIDLDKNTNLSNEIWHVMNLEVPQNLIGVDLELEFESAEKEREFSKNEGVSPICNIYYFNGTLHQGLFGKATLYVKDYAIIPKSKNCISQIIQD